MHVHFGSIVGGKPHWNLPGNSIAADLENKAMGQTFGTTGVYQKGQLVFHIYQEKTPCDFGHGSTVTIPLSQPETLGQKLARFFGGHLKPAYDLKVQTYGQRQPPGEDAIRELTEDLLELTRQFEEKHFAAQDGTP